MRVLGRPGLPTDKLPIGGRVAPLAHSPQVGPLIGIAPAHQWMRHRDDVMDMLRKLVAPLDLTPGKGLPDHCP